MIHPMWHEYMKTVLPAVWASDDSDHEDPGDTRKWIAELAAEMADLACAEYDKRNASTATNRPTVSSETEERLAALK